MLREWHEVGMEGQKMDPRMVQVHLSLRRGSKSKGLGLEKIRFVCLENPDEGGEEPDRNGRPVTC